MTGGLAIDGYTRVYGDEWTGASLVFICSWHISMEGERWRNKAAQALMETGHAGDGHVKYDNVIGATQARGDVLDRIHAFAGVHPSWPPSR